MHIIAAVLGKMQVWK